jgi:hypothetical protein
VAVELEARAAAYVKCANCGAAVDVLTRPGTVVSFPHALRGALRLPVSFLGLGLLFTLAATASELAELTEPARTAALLAWSAVAWCVGVAIVSASAEGATTLPSVPVEWPDVIRPALVATALTAPALWVPRTGRPGFALVAAGALALVPLLLRLFARQSHPLSPLGAARTLSRLGADGLLAVGCVAGVWLFARMLAALSDSPPTEVPLLWRKGLDILAALSLFLVPRLLGLLLQARGEDVGYPFVARGHVPALPGASPEQTVAYRAPEPPLRASPQAIALEETDGALVLESLAPDGSEKT